MSIRIVRNANGNCIQFVGSSQPAYWNSCLSGQVNADDDTRVDVINDIRTTDSDAPFYEFYGIPYTDLTDKDGNSFADATAAAAYISQQANVIGGAILFDATDQLDASRDATNTSILFSTGDSFGVNAIKAVAQADGNITIQEHIDDGEAIFKDIRPSNITVGGDLPTSTSVTAVVNTLNALFTVTPLGLGGIDAEETYTTVTSVVDNTDFTVFGDVTESAGVYTKGTNTGNNVNDGLYSGAIITRDGEYFEFDVDGHSGDNLFGGAFVMGFKNAADNVTEITGNTENMGGLDLAVRFRGMNSSENHDYGIVIENGFYENPKTSTQFRLGLDADRRLYISHYNATEEEWQILVRSAFETTNEEYRIVFFLKRENAFLPLDDAKFEEVDPAGITVAYRYIESPDGSFYYPLFASAEEANWVDQLNGGSGTNHQHTFIDETPTSNIWYMPDTGGTHAGASAPSDTATITYTEILTGADADYAPDAFSISDLTVDENAAVNYQVAPAGASFTTTVSGLPSGLSLSGNNIVGTAPEVTGLNDVNPSDVSTVTVTRTNSFGSANTTFDITVNNLDAPVTTLSGFTHESTSTTLVDTDTLAAGSVVSIDDLVNDGNRFILNREFVDNHILPAITAGSGTKSVFIGFADSAANWSNGVSSADFDVAFEWYSDNTNKSNNNHNLRAHKDGVQENSLTISSTTNGFYDTVFINADTNIKIGALDGNTYNPTTKVYNASSAQWNSAYVSTGHTAGNKTLYIGTAGTTLDIDLDDFSEVSEPGGGSIITSWTKAVDLSGGSEHLSQNNNSYQYQPIQMADVGATTAAPTTSGYTSNDSASAPWATAIVFKSDGNASNQHIWNQGEGTGSTDDNIYIRQAADGYMYFGWGRDGHLNECRIGDGFNTNTQQWFGLYVGFNGRRMSGTNATAANLADAFDIRFMSRNVSNNSEWEILTGTYADAVGNRSTSNNWNAGSTGGRMDRKVNGNFTIGGRGSNRNWHGKVASCVVTTLRRNQPMPVTAEIEAMIVDPTGWLTDYKVGNTFKSPASSSEFTNFQVGSGIAYLSTQVWLMGDGSSDSYSNGIRNQVYYVDNSYTKLNFNNMVSSDIETVSIPGLS